MWVYFGTNTQQVKTFQHGAPARQGSANQFSIFAVFEGTTTTTYPTAKATIQTPGGTVLTTEYSMPVTTKKFIRDPNFDPLIVTPLVDGTSYSGYELVFDDSAMLSEYGQYQVTINLYSNDVVAVSGLLKFNCEQSIVLGDTYITKTQYQDLLGVIAKHSFPVRYATTINSVIQSATAIKNYSINDIIYDETNKSLYKITNITTTPDAGGNYATIELIDIKIDDLIANNLYFDYDGDTVIFYDENTSSYKFWIDSASTLEILDGEIKMVNGDLGDSTDKWKDLYLSGSIKDGTNSVSTAQIVSTNANDQNITGKKNFNGGIATPRTDLTNWSIYDTYGNLYLNRNSGAGYLYANTDIVPSNNGLLLGQKRASGRFDYVCVKYGINTPNGDISVEDLAAITATDVVIQ